MIGNQFLQGDIWVVRLDPAEGSEVRKTRPCLVVSCTEVNDCLKTVTVIPFSSGFSNGRFLRINVLSTSGNGLQGDSHLLVHQIRTVSKERFKTKIGRIERFVLGALKKSFELYFEGIY